MVRFCCPLCVSRPWLRRHHAQLWSRAFLRRADWLSEAVKRLRVQRGDGSATAAARCRERVSDRRVFGVPKTPRFSPDRTKWLFELDSSRNGFGSHVLGRRDNSDARVCSCSLPELYTTDRPLGPRHPTTALHSGFLSRHFLVLRDRFRSAETPS